MKDKEKALEIALEYEDLCVIDLEDVAMEAMQWKEQQMIDKACEWWETEFTYPTMSQVEIDWLQTKIVSFRKAMEE